MRFRWPEGLVRIPPEDWTRAPVETLARKYDTVETHGWYRNLEPTVDALRRVLRPGDILLDYSAGTGILERRLLRPEDAFGVLLVDSSPKFLRMALERLGADERCAFRLIRYLKDERRLERLDEVLPESLRRRGVEAVVSTNAIHLYYDLDDTIASWFRLLRPGGLVHAQSGNIRNPAAPPGVWIIDETVEAIHRRALEIVREEDRYAPYRASAGDPDRMAAYAALRRKFFLPVRPLEHYVTAFERAGFVVEGIDYRRFEARVDEWYEFLSAYHEGVLGWVGGAARVEGRPPSEEAVRDRLALLREATEAVFEGRERFPVGWTYLTARRPKD